MPNYVIVEVVNERIQPNAFTGTYDDVLEFIVHRGASTIHLHANGYGIAVVNPTVKFLVFQTQPIDTL